MNPFYPNTVPVLEISNNNSFITVFNKCNDYHQRLIPIHRTDFIEFRLVNFVYDGHRDKVEVTETKLCVVMCAQINYQMLRPGMFIFDVQVYLRNI